MIGGSRVFPTHPIAPSPRAMRVPTAFVSMWWLAAVSRAPRLPALLLVDRQLPAVHAQQRHGALQGRLEQLRQLELAREVGERVEQRLLLGRHLPCYPCGYEW